MQIYVLKYWLCAHNNFMFNFSIAVTRSKNVPMFGPPIPAGALFSKSSSFTKFILTKVINAENAAHRSDKFVSMATRTRQEYLKDLATNYSTQTTIDSGSKFGKSDKKLDYRPNDLILFQLFSIQKRSFQ